MKDELKPWRGYANWMLGILVANILLCVNVIGLLLLIPIGIWQVMDAIVYYYHGDRRRKRYLIVVVLYLLFLPLYSFKMSLLGDNTWLTLIVFILIPYIIAFWYWSIVNRHANEVSAVEEPDDDDLERHLIG